MDPERLSVDPDYPEDKSFNYTWFCRVIDPVIFKEEWEEWNIQVDENGFPIYNASMVLSIPPKDDPALINPPPGCFGKGPGPLKTNKGFLKINTAQLTTYALTFEFLLILTKDTRRLIDRRRHYLV